MARSGRRKAKCRRPNLVWTVICCFWLSVFSIPLSAQADAEHLLFLADDGLAVIRLQIEIDGESNHQLCRDCVQAICTQADRDHDGWLTTEEYDAVIATHPVLQERQEQTSQRQNREMKRPDFGPLGKAPVDTVTAFLLREVWQPLRLEFASSSLRRINAAGELLDRPLSDTQLFERLDTDGNRKLTSRELENAAAVLAKLDFDDDETINLAELRLQTTPNGMPAGNPNRTARRSDSHLVHLSPGRIDAPFVRRVLALYDGEADDSIKDLRLDRRELGLAELLFAAADADEDGYWDFDELWRFLERPSPTAEINVHLATDTGTATGEFSTHEPMSARLLEQVPHLVSFEIRGTWMHFVLQENPPQHSQLRMSVASNFKESDRNGDDYLDPDEFSMEDDDESKSFFEIVDSDHDGKVSFVEVTEFNRIALTSAELNLAIAVENLERTLFNPLDDNHDGRLSHRELGRLNALLTQWDADGDGKLVEAEIPRQYRLTLIRGGNDPSGPSRADAASTAGPRWFLKMDRNRDGEVSAREFLGPSAHFEKIDTNADRAIDAAEAAAVK